MVNIYYGEYYIMVNMVLYYGIILWWSCGSLWDNHLVDFNDFSIQFRHLHAPTNEHNVTAHGDKATKVE